MLALIMEKERMRMYSSINRKYVTQESIVRLRLVGDGTVIRLGLSKWLSREYWQTLDRKVSMTRIGR